MGCGDIPPVLYVDECVGLQVVLGWFPGNLVFIFQLIRPLTLLLNCLISPRGKHLLCEVQSKCCPHFRVSLILSWEAKKAIKICVVIKFTVMSCELVLVLLPCLGVFFVYHSDGSCRIGKRLNDLSNTSCHLSQFRQVFLAHFLVVPVCFHRHKRSTSKSCCIVGGSKSEEVSDVSEWSNPVFSTFSDIWPRLFVSQKIQSVGDQRFLRGFIPDQPHSQGEFPQLPLIYANSSQCINSTEKEWKPVKNLSTHTTQDVAAQEVFMVS